MIVNFDLTIYSKQKCDNLYYRNYFVKKMFSQLSVQLYVKYLLLHDVIYWFIHCLEATEYYWFTVVHCMCLHLFVCDSSGLVNEADPVRWTVEDFKPYVNVSVFYSNIIQLRYSHVRYDVHMCKEFLSRG